MINKKVSVIIPNYNKRDYIEECIESVLTQTYTNIEIVVVDDCSTDNSRLLLEKLAHEHDNITLVFLEKNGGVCNARNVGAQRSTGYYLTFLDSDDVYINDKKIENEVNLIGSDEDIAFSQWVPLDSNAHPISKELAKVNVYDSRYAIVKVLSISRPAYQQLRGYLITRHLFDKVGGYTFPYNCYEDFDFQCRLVLAGRLRYTYEFGEGYRNVPGGLSKQEPFDSRKIIASIQNTYFKKLSIDQKIDYRLITFIPRMKAKFKYIVARLESIF